jgi:hypothetical protein
LLDNAHVKLGLYLAPLVISSVAACAADRDIESMVSIHEGAYGLLLSEGNIGAGIGVTVELPPSPGSVHGASVDASSTDHDGVYQFELEPGAYQLCTESCVLIEVPDEERVRHDWVSGPDGGSWCDGPC